MAIQLTESAAAEIRRYRESQKVEESKFLRIGVLGGGCSGFQYTMQFDADYDRHVDHKYQLQGLDIVVDKKSALYLDGTKVDWQNGDYGAGFTFDNPNVARSCACGH
ncbi:MAG: iron-sulfur cluster assembly accessory protein [Planctomycetes bacterium]|nr:iron-sulfur cluster assembly accessory protein [Planctomycetota bacterium]